MEKKHEIEKLAYEIYVRSGYLCGHELDHWIEAEQIICAKCEPDVKAKKTPAKKNAAVSESAKSEVKPTASGKGRSAGRPKKNPNEERALL